MDGQPETVAVKLGIPVIDEGLERGPRFSSVLFQESDGVSGGDRPRLP